MMFLSTVCFRSKWKKGLVQNKVFACVKPAGHPGRHRYTFLMGWTLDAV